MKFKLDTTCECPNIIRYHRTPGETVPIIKTGRCKLDITCATHTMTYFYFYLGRNGSEIPRPDDMMIEDGSNYVGAALGVERTNETIEAPPGPPIDIFSYFGVLCHNGEWYVSKYPTGVGYRNKDSVYNYIGTNGELDGKKAKIEEFAW
ncbi:hypothetical protein GCK72_007630 [Caenorhabditis remanei]|nr:hypothetical protein GCK72_007630 [Caenorhabditis remanei]KAF1767671.1 hypothetical protein GCK72_007630 [Caenorhabditis remanei]